MDRHRKRIIFRISVSAIFLCLITGSVFWKAYYADAVTAGEIESISSIKTLEILDNQPEAGRWTPKDQRASLSKIESWLKQAELYKGRLPQSDIVPPLPLDISVNQIN
ncbi:MAG: hypothetical protein Q8930_16400, partial [Bacillota bacterium]|nr:hypothetical protein [Bacillota bacterium]